MDEKVTRNEQKVTRNQQKVTRNQQKVTSNKQKAMSNEQKATSNEQKVTINEQKLTSNEQRAKSKKFSLIKKWFFNLFYKLNLQETPASEILFPLLIYILHKKIREHFSVQEVLIKMVGGII